VTTTRRPWIALVLAWAVAVFGVGYLSYRQGEHTDREQSPIGQALPMLDAVLGDVAAALPAGAGVVPVLSDYLPVEQDCGITVVRDGIRYQRVLELYVSPTGVTALLEGIAAGLPARYRARMDTRFDAPELALDTGKFVGVRATTPAPGRVQIAADTGCRAAEGPVRFVERVADPSARAPVQAVLDAVGLPASAWRSYRITCSGGGELRTVEARTGGMSATAVGGALPPSARRFPGEPGAPETYTFRSGGVAVAVRVGAEYSTVTATTTC